MHDELGFGLRLFPQALMVPGHCDSSVGLQGVGFSRYSDIGYAIMLLVARARFTAEQPAGERLCTVPFTGFRKRPTCPPAMAQERGWRLLRLAPALAAGCRLPAAAPPPAARCRQQQGQGKSVGLFPTRLLNRGDGSEDVFALSAVWFMAVPMPV